MALISLDLNQSRSTAGAFQSSSNALDDLCGQLQGQWARLAANWEGDSKHYVADEVQNALNRAARVAQLTRERGTKLTQIADRFQAADENVPFDVTPISWSMLIAAAAGAEAGVAAALGAGGPINSAPPTDLFSVLTGKVRDGINAVYHAGEQFVNGVNHVLDDVGQAAIQVSDQAVTESLSTLLPRSRLDSTESLEFEIKGDVTIPGAEAGVPGSFKLAGAGSGKITRNPDGTYTLTLSAEGGGGLKETLAEAKGTLKVGSQKFGVGAEVSGDALAMGETEVAFRFDPRTPGDMTKMAAFVSTLGLAATPLGQIAAPTMVGPALYTLKDNLDSIKVGAGADGHAAADVSALVKLAGVEGNMSGRTGMNLYKEGSGWHMSDYTELGGGVKANLFTDSAGLEGKLTVENITDLQTTQQHARVTLELTGTEGRAIELKDIEKYVPKSALSSVQIQSDQYGKVSLEYTLDSPADSVVKSLIPASGPPNLQPIIDNSHIKINGSIGSETGLGASGQVGAATQSVGIGGEVNLKRESEVTILES